MSKRKLSVVEQREIERLEKQKDMYISIMMGKCELINEMIKEVNSGSWLAKMKAIKNAVDLAEDDK